MRASFIALVASTVVLSASAIAAPSVTPNTGEGAITTQTVRGTVYKMHLSDMAEYKGDYLTDTGRLRVSFEKRKLYAVIDNEAKTEILPVANNTFVTRDESTKIIFD